MAHDEQLECDRCWQDMRVPMAGSYFWLPDEAADDGKWLICGNCIEAHEVERATRWGVPTISEGKDIFEIGYCWPEEPHDWIGSPVLFRKRDAEWIVEKLRSFYFSAEERPA
jgi:hypothetical protein